MSDWYKSRSSVKKTAALALTCTPSVVIALSLMLNSGTSFAEALNQVSPESLISQSRIIGGTDAAECIFPSAVGLKTQRTMCTGTLVHPEIVFSAGHCEGDDIKYAVFGETMDADRRVDVEYCKAHPDWALSELGKGVDYSFCKLKEPVNDVPIIPILMGCEIDVLQEGASVYAVGFGYNKMPEREGLGTKRWAEMEFQGYINDEGLEEALVGAPGKQGCQGDSGGPVYVKLPEDKFGADAGWRVFGVTTAGDPNCSQGYAQYGVMWNFVEFLEKESGIDVTPCHDADGTWNPSSKCNSAPLSPLDGGGSWPSSCEAGPVGGTILSCGDNDDDDDDDSDSSEESTESSDTGTDEESSDSTSDGDESSSSSSESSDDDGDDDDNDDDDDDDDDNDDDSDDDDDDDNDDDSDDDDSSSEVGSNSESSNPSSSSPSSTPSDGSEKSKGSTKGKGGGCSVSTHPSSALWPLMFLGVLPLWRRRRLRGNGLPRIGIHTNSRR